jgi:tRNA-intron endonuclease
MEKIQAQLIGNTISTNSVLAYTLNEKSQFGERIGEKIQYSLAEAFYLLEINKLEILSNKKFLSKNEVLEKIQKIDKKFSIKYAVFRDLRNKGYILKTALKFGADFRIYEKGKKPGKAHSRWILYADQETNKIKWQDFAAKTRIANSTKKNLLIAIVDDEEKVTYYEIKWLKP